MTQDEVTAFVAGWEEEVLMSWREKDKPNLAEDEEIIEILYTRSSGLLELVLLLLVGKSFVSTTFQLKRSWKQ